MIWKKKKKAVNALYQSIHGDTIILSTQTLGEFSRILIKEKIKVKTIENFFFEIIEAFPIVEINLVILSQAYKLLRKYSLSWWDAVIISTAIENECNILYSEDFKHNQIIEDKLKIINPLL